MPKRLQKTTDEPRELATSGALCLAFANTAAPRRDDRRVVPETSDPIGSYGDLVTWSRRMGAVDDGVARGLAAAAEKRPRDASATLDRALELRAVLVRVFTAQAASRKPRPADMKVLNDALAPALAARRLVAGARGAEWTWTGEAEALDRVLWPMAVSAAELLTSDDVRRLRSCADSRCPRLFVDRSRSRKRLWCDMSLCGSRAKNRRYRRRFAGLPPSVTRIRSPDA